MGFPVRRRIDAEALSEALEPAEGACPDRIELIPNASTILAHMRPLERWRLCRSYERILEAERLRYVRSVYPYAGVDKVRLLVVVVEGGVLARHQLRSRAPSPRRQCSWERARPICPANRTGRARGLLCGSSAAKLLADAAASGRFERASRRSTAIGVLAPFRVARNERAPTHRLSVSHGCTGSRNEPIRRLAKICRPRRRFTSVPRRLQRALLPPPSACSCARTESETM